MKRTYNANRAPGDWWNDLEDEVRQSLVVRYHRKKRIELPNELVHAMIHVVVENQAQLGDKTPVAAALDRLQSEGLTRHDAVHAVGSRLAGVIFAIGTGKIDSDDMLLEQYYDGIRSLSKAAWLAEYDDADL